MRHSLVGLAFAATLAACASRPEPAGYAVASTAEGAAKANSLAISAANKAAPTPPQTLREVGSAMAYISAHRAELFDANHDGRYGFVEWLASNFSAFLVYNVAKDGRLTEREFVQFRCGPDTQPFSGCAMSGSPEMGRRRDNVRREFALLDSGHKGYLVANDLRREALGYFTANDVNRDGWVTDAEVAFVARGRRPAQADAD